MSFGASGSGDRLRRPASGMGPEGSTRSTSPASSNIFATCIAVTGSLRSPMTRRTSNGRPKPSSTRACRWWSFRNRRHPWCPHVNGRTKPSVHPSPTTGRRCSPTRSPQQYRARSARGGGCPRAIEAEDQRRDRAGDARRSCHGRGWRSRSRLASLWRGRDGGPLRMCRPGGRGVCAATACTLARRPARRGCTWTLRRDGLSVPADLAAWLRDLHDLAEAAPPAPAPPAPSAWMDVATAADTLGLSERRVTQMASDRLFRWRREGRRKLMLAAEDVLHEADRRRDIRNRKGSGSAYLSRLAG